MPDLASLSVIKEALQIVGSAEDTFLNDLISRVSGEFHLAIKPRILVEQQHTELRAGSGTQFFQLRQYPITLISSVHVSIDIPRIYDATTLVPAADYEANFDNGQLYYYGNIWPSGPNTVKVVYSAGYATIPADVQGVVQEIVIRKYLKTRHKMLHIGETSEPEMGRMTVRDDDRSFEHRGVINSYKPKYFIG